MKNKYLINRENLRKLLHYETSFTEVNNILSNLSIGKNCIAQGKNGNWLRVVTKDRVHFSVYKAEY